jgi:LysM repeat protein
MLQEANSSKIRQEGVNSKTGTAGEQIHDLQTASVPTLGTKADEPASDEAAGSERNGVKARQTKVVVVKKGDSLFKIINRAYGKYNNSILKDVVRENPEINSLDRIYEGQVIKLPRPADKTPEG